MGCMLFSLVDARSTKIEGKISLLFLHFSAIKRVALTFFLIMIYITYTIGLLNARSQEVQVGRKVKSSVPISIPETIKLDLKSNQAKLNPIVTYLKMLNKSKSSLC
jgi:hypothetical protein